MRVRVNSGNRADILCTFSVKSDLDLAFWHIILYCFYADVRYGEI